MNCPFKHYLQCCTDFSVLMGVSEKGEDLYKKYPNLEILSRQLMTNVFLEQQAKLEAFTINTPIGRYQNLIGTRPDLLKRIPQYQITSYIGFTLQSLSRICKRLLVKSKK